MYLEKLRNFYKNDCLFYLISFGCSPYIIALEGYKWYQDSKEVSEEDLAYAAYGYIGVAVCTVFTIIPILPLLTAITLGTALVAGAIALISPIVTYPLAMLMDYIAEHPFQFNKLDKSLTSFLDSMTQIAGFKAALRFIFPKEKEIKATVQHATEATLPCTATPQSPVAPSTSSAPREFFSYPQQAPTHTSTQELKM